MTFRFKFRFILSLALGLWGITVLAQTTLRVPSSSLAIRALTFVTQQYSFEHSNVAFTVVEKTSAAVQGEVGAGTSQFGTQTLDPMPSSDASKLVLPAFSIAVAPVYNLPSLTGLLLPTSFEESH